MSLTYELIKQQEGDDTIEAEEFQERACSCHATRPVSTMLLLIGHVLLFGIYALSLYYISPEQPSDRACTMEMSTHCKVLDLVREV